MRRSKLFLLAFILSSLFAFTSGVMAEEDTEAYSERIQELYSDNLLDDETETETEEETEEETEKETEAETEEEIEETTEEITEAHTETEQTETEAAHTEDVTESDLIEEISEVSDAESIETELVPLTPEELEDETEFRLQMIDSANEILIRKGAVLKEEKEDSSKDIAIAKDISRAHILDDIDDGWLFIESGNARGFVRKTEVVTDAIASGLLENKPFDEFQSMTLIIVNSENKASDFTNTTMENNVVNGVRMKTSAIVDVKESQSADSKSVGRMEVGSVCYVLEDLGNGWVYIESGDVRGFVEVRVLLQASSFEETGEKLADTLVLPSENAALKYSMKSVKAADDISRVRKSMVEFALQYIGNPYVWGGTSLTNGADCSGFVQTIYALYGIQLPRVACDQAVAGPQIPIEEAKPGDLIFYSSAGYVYHVSMYIGDGQVVHASNSRDGIITSGINGNACWAVNFLD